MAQPKQILLEKKGGRKGRRNEATAKAAAKPKASDVANVHVNGRSGPGSKAAIKVAAEGEHTIGDLYFYSVPYDLEVPEMTALKHAKDNSIPEPWMPKIIKGANAFKRATDDLRTEEQQVSHEGEPARETILVVDAAVLTRRQKRAMEEGDGDEDAPKVDKAAVAAAIKASGVQAGDDEKVVRRFVVRQTSIGMAKPLYLVLGHIDFTESSGIEGQCDSDDDDEALDQFNQMVKLVEGKYKHCLETYIDRDVRNILVRAQRELKCIPLRSSGGIYFAPEDARERLGNVRKFLLDIGCPDFKVVPVSPAVYTPEEIADKLTEVLSGESKKIVEEYTKAKAAGGMSQDRYQSLVRKHRETLELFEHYQKVLKVDLSQANMRLTAVQNHMKEMASLVGKSGKKKGA